MLELMSEPLLLALFGGIGGLALGLAARLGRFCTLGAIEDLLYGGSDVRLRMWGVAIGVGVIGTYALHAVGYLDLGTSLYLSQTWSPMSSILGGLLFGYGMALSGNCGFGALARLGGGDLRSFVIVLVMGLASYITLAGPLAALRVGLFPVEQAGANTPGIAHGLSQLTGLSATAIGLTLGLVILALSGGKLMRNGHGASLFWGAVVGLAIVSGWAGTYWLSENGFLATLVRSHTFSAPIGETMLYAMTSSGSTLTFGIGSVFGVLTGAFIGSLIKGHFRWEACEDPRELRRQILGAVLMGIGAVTAVGCSVGQGISAFSVLAYSAPVTMAAIIAGAALGLRQLITGFASVS
ncbi:MAG: YeeE/YedE family protein [Litoreibacter sp.]|nr:YeeE/YedE family protein [Litoreibacter sp.]